MLHFLLVKVSESHFNSEDSEILYKKIVRLFHKMDSQQGLKDLKESTNNFFNDFISTSEDEIKQDVKYFQKYAKLYAKYGLDFGVSEDLLKIIKDFQADFLN